MIVTPDIGKDVENRKWPTSYRGPILIHSGASRSDMRRPDLARYAARMPTNEPAFAGIVGYAEITDCVTASDSPWFFGPYGFVLAHARALPFVPALGQLGFFAAPDLVLESLRGLV